MREISILEKQGKNNTVCKLLPKSLIAIVFIMFIFIILVEKYLDINALSKQDWRVGRHIF